MATPAGGAARAQKCANPCCVTAHEKGTPLWRKGWALADGSMTALCNPCGILFKRGWYCSWCHAVHRPPLDGAPAVYWLPCDYCDAWVHAECEHKHAPETLQGESYACPACRAKPRGALSAPRAPLAAPPAAGQATAREARVGRRVAFSRPFMRTRMPDKPPTRSDGDSEAFAAPLGSPLPAKRRRMAPGAMRDAAKPERDAPGGGAAAERRPPAKRGKRPTPALATPRDPRRDPPAATSSPPNALQLLVSASATLVPSPDQLLPGQSPSGDAAAPNAAAAGPVAGAASRAPRARRPSAAAKRGAAASAADAAAADTRDMAAFTTPPAGAFRGVAAAEADALAAELRGLAATLRDTASGSEGGPSPPAVVQRLRLVLTYLRHVDATAAALRASGAARHVAPLMAHADQFVASAARELCAQAPWAEAVAELRASSGEAAAAPCCAKCKLAACSCRSRARSRRTPPARRAQQLQTTVLLPPPPEGCEPYGCDDAFREGLRRISGEQGAGAGCDADADAEADAAAAEAHARSWEAADAQLAGLLSLPPGALLCLPSATSPAPSPGGLLVEAPVLLAPPPSPLSRLLMAEGVPPSCRPFASSPSSPFTTPVRPGAAPRLVLPPGGASSPTAAHFWSLGAPQSPAFALQIEEEEAPSEAPQH